MYMCLCIYIHIYHDLNQPSAAFLGMPRWERHWRCPLAYRQKKKNGGPQFESPEETKCCQPLWEYGSRSFITSRTTEKTASLADIWISALQWPRLNYSWTPPDLQKLCDAKYM